MMVQTNPTKHETEPQRQRSKIVNPAWVVLFVALTFCWADEAYRSSHTEIASPIVLVSKRDLSNFHAVHPYLYRGGAPSYAGLDELKRLGVKTIVDLRTTPVTIAAEHQHVAKLGIQHTNIPMGNMSIPSLEQQRQVLAAIVEAEHDPNRAPLFLHCAHGSDRTGFMVAAWRVQHDHWSVLEASAEMLSDGFLVHKLDPKGHVR